MYQCLKIHQSRKCPHYPHRLCLHLVFISRESDHRWVWVDIILVGCHYLDQHQELVVMMDMLFCCNGRFLIGLVIAFILRCLSISLLTCCLAFIFF
jgi:hypothetical protein